MASTACSLAFAATRRRPAPRSGCSRRAASTATGTCAISPRNSGITSTPSSRPARICGSIRSSIGPRPISGPIHGAKASRSFRSISPKAANAIARLAMPTSPSRCRRRPAQSTRSSPSSIRRGPPSAPAARWITRLRTLSSDCASLGIFKQSVFFLPSSSNAAMNAHVAAAVAIPSKLQELRAAASRPLVRIVVAGHVDHGKSTLIGRLLSETGSLPDGKLDELKAVSARRGMSFEWSFLLDALQTERDQGITIDTSQIRFRTPSRDFVLIDAPGHAEFVRNMITGASQADAALLIVDAAEGVREQTLRHSYLLHLLGIRQVLVVINKMDRAGYDSGRFAEIEAEIVGHLGGFGLTPAAVIP